MKIALTGGMGCGKSTVARLFETAGCHRLDADELVRTHALPHPEVLAACHARWGDSILTPDGQIHRPSLASLIFSDDAQRLWLEALVHPLVIAAWQTAIATAPSAFWVVEIPLLFEKGLQKGFDFTVCVSASSPVQLSRLAARGLPPALAEPRISKQLPLAQKEQLADAVILNDGSRSFLHEQVTALLGLLRARA